MLSNSAGHSGNGRSSFSLLCLLLICAGVLPRVTVTDSISFSSTSANEERGLIALEQALRDLGNPFTLMYVAARPGDEDTGTLFYYRRKLGARTVTVFATRGEGDDSATVAETDDDLGVRQTQEALHSCQLAGSDAYFLNLADFGFSKSREETITTWGHDETLRRLVTAIRRVRPDVVITGNETTAYQKALTTLLLESYGAAADPTRFTDVAFEPWQVSRIFERADERNASLDLDLAEYDPIRGKTFADLTRQATQQYTAKSIWPATDKRYYRLLKPVPVAEPFGPGSSFFTGLSLSENLLRELAPPRVGDLPAIQAIGQTDSLVQSLVETLVLKQAQGSARDLQQRYGTDLLRFIRYVETLQRAIRYALGLDFQVKLSDQVVAQGGKFKASVMVRNGSGRQLPVILHAPKPLIDAGNIAEFQESEVKTLSPGFALVQDYQYDVPIDAQLTIPHNKHLREEDYYSTSLPVQPFGRTLSFFVEAQVERTTITIPITLRVDIAPRFEINVTPDFGLIKDWQTPRDMSVSIELLNHTSERFEGSFWIVSLALLSDDYQPTRVSLPARGVPVRLDFKLNLPISKPPLSSDVLVELRDAAPDSRSAVASAKIRVVPTDISTAEGLTIGYASGANGSLGLALKELGVEYSKLSPRDIESSDLHRFSCVIIGQDAYQPDLAKSRKRLLDYVEGGGELVIFSQRPEDWNADIFHLPPAPYPLKLSPNRVSVETAPVKILDPPHVVLTKPNQISERDFQGWVNERAENLPSEWGTAYTPLLESSDPGEPPQRGGLLIASYGKGSFIYTSYSWERQLRAVNLGAYRVLANIISYAKVQK